jgi:hypothetical protein
MHQGAVNALKRALHMHYDLTDYPLELSATASQRYAMSSRLNF